VRASAAGTLQVLFKWHYLRSTYHLDAGSNRLRLRLPAAFAGGRRQIVFTVYSTTGARGSTIKRHVTIRVAA
jgi:hypothetical protein